MKVLHSICQLIWKTQPWPQDWKRSIFIPIPKKGNAKEWSNYYIIALISHTSKAILKIIQARLQQYMNFQTFKLVLEKAEEPEIKLQTSAGSLKNKESSRKTSISDLLTMPKPLTVDHSKLWKILKEMGIPDHLTCLLINLHAGQEATVRTGPGKTDLFKIGKGVHQGGILPPCLFNFYAEYITRNAGLDEAQAGIKIGRRNINNLRYADNTTFVAESEEELKSLLMKVKEETEKVGLKRNRKQKVLQKTKIMALVPQLHGK